MNILVFAFGLGLTRLVMMKYGIDDIRQITGADFEISKTILIKLILLYMLVSLNWIKKYVDLPKDLDVKDLGLKLTMSTVEVEEVNVFADFLQNVVVGKVVKEIWRQKSNLQVNDAMKKKIFKEEGLTIVNRTYLIAEVLKKCI